MQPICKCKETYQHTLREEERKSDAKHLTGEKRTVSVATNYRL